MAPPPEDRPHQEEDDDGSWVNAELLRELLEEGATVLNIEAESATGKGDNYLSVLYRTRVEYHTVESKEMQVLNLIVKGIPPGEYRQNFIEETGVFQREISVYNDILPHLYEFADSKLGKGSFRRFSAGFYNISRPDTLIFDDLKPQGFVMAPRRDRLDLAHSKMVVQNLARLHALSVAYEETHPGSISQYPDTVFAETSFERLNQFMPQVLKTITEDMKKREGFGSIANKLEALQDSYLRKVLNVCKIENCRRTVFIHGDTWVNNILFKYSETGRPIDLRFVDFQLSREASPALDLNYFLFTSTRTDVRALHLENLLQEYCDEFERWAKDLGYSGTPITFEEIRREMDRTALFGFLTSMSLLPVVLAEPKDIPDMENLTEEGIKNGELQEFDHVYTSTTFFEAFESILLYFDGRGVFD